jgi:hypothetical protein
MKKQFQISQLINSNTMKHFKLLFSIILLLLTTNLSAQLTLNDTKKLEPISKALEPWDTATKLNYQISAGSTICSPSYLDPIPVYPLGYSFDFNQDKTTPMTSIFLNSYGFSLRNSLSLDLKNNPISPRVDLSYSNLNFNMIQYDQFGSEINQSWFREINLMTVSAGFDVGGKYLNFGIQYRFGYCSKGVNNEQLPFVPDIVKNNELNLISNVYQGLDLSIGAQYKNFNLTYRRGIPITNPIQLQGALFGGLMTMGLEIGYIIKI